MKNHLLLLITVLSCMACSKDDTKPDPLIGRWHLYSKEEIATVNGVSQHRIDTLNDRESYIEFTSSGALLTIEGNGKFRLANDSVYIAIDYTGSGRDVEDIPYKYKIVNEILTLERSETPSETHFTNRANYKRL